MKKNLKAILKEAFTNHRYYILMPIGILGLMLVFSDVDESIPFVEWVRTLIAGKLLGIGLVYVAYQLFMFWHRRNRIPLLSALLEEDEEEVYNDEE